MSNLTEEECRALLDRDQSFRSDTGDFDEELYLDILNEMEDEFFDLAIRAAPKKFLTAQTLNSGTLTHNIATLYSMDVLGSWVFKTDNDGNITTQKLPKTQPGSSETGWYLDESIDGGGDIKFTPLTIPADDYIAKYVVERTVLVSGATTLFPKTKARTVKRGLLRLYQIWRKNPDARTQDALYQKYLLDLVSNFSIDPAAGLGSSNVAF